MSVASCKWKRRAAGWFAASAFACGPAVWASQSLAPLLACRGIADPAARLQCFDRQTATLAADAAPTKVPAQPSVATAGSPSAPSSGAVSMSPSVPSSGAVSASPAAPASSVAAGAAASASAASASAEALQNFGLPPNAIASKEVAAGKRPADLSRIHAHVSDLSRAGDGRMVFTLDNGQIWLQVLSEGDLLLRPGDDVTISRALFQSFMLKTGSGRGCRVTRIR